MNGNAMENRRQTVRTLTRCQIEGARSCTAEIVELPTPVAIDEDARVPGLVAMLVAAAGSGHIARTRLALWNHPETSQAILRTLTRNVPVKSSVGSFPFELRYRGHRVLSCAYSALAGISAAFVEHPGYTLFGRYFSMVSGTSIGHSIPIEVLVVLQPPAFSALERQMQERVPMELSLVNQGLGLGGGTPLMITDQGCALGGLLSKVAVMTLRRGGGPVSNHVEGKQSGAETGPSTAPGTERVSLIEPAEALLRHHLEALV
jgi:hypothetical protein